MPHVPHDCAGNAQVASCCVSPLRTTVTGGSAQAWYAGLPSVAEGMMLGHGVNRTWQPMTPRPLVHTASRSLLVCLSRRSALGYTRTLCRPHVVHEVEKAHSTPGNRRPPALMPARRQPPTPPGP